MKRTAFTLVELLAAITVLGILAGMVVVALNGAQADARIKRAEGQVINVQSILRDEMAEFQVRRYRISTRNTVDLKFTPEQASRARLLLVRDQMRMALPDRISDIAVSPAVLFVDGQNPFTGVVGWGALDRETLPAGGPYNQPLRSVAQDRYQRTVVRLMRSAGIIGPGDGWQGAGGALETWNANPEFQSAECLYLILSQMTIDGMPVIDSLRGSEIEDTNDNGIPEIVDPWGNPLLWMRWPTGYWLTYAIRDRVAAAGGSLNDAGIYAHMYEQRERLGPDSNDFLLSDWRFSDPDDRHSTADDSAESRDDLDPFNCPPLIVSAGSDGEFDLNHAIEMPYAVMEWPQAWMPSAPAGRPGTYFYPDPYQTNYLPNGVFSMVGAFNGDIRDDRSVDNIFSGVAE